MTHYVPTAERLFELEVTCDLPTPLGRLRGGNGLMIPITGGTVSGEKLAGEVLAGGADWAIRYDNGSASVDARYAIKAEDGTIIQVFNSGSAHMDKDSPSLRMLTTPRFIAPEGAHEWLNHATFVGTVEPDLSGRSSVHIVVYKMV